MTWMLALLSFCTVQSKQPGGYPGKQTAKGDAIKKSKKQLEAAKVMPDEAPEEAATATAAAAATSADVDLTQETSVSQTQPLCFNVHGPDTVFVLYTVLISCA